MDLYLHRTHYKAGTNGALFHRDEFLCFCIELPWRLNERNRSCIPDGTYELVSFFSPTHLHHFIVKNVKDRSGILLHPANDAKKELRGCIAPVMQLDGIGKGSGSRRALDKIVMRTEAFLGAHEPLFLTILSEQSGR